MPCPYSAVCHLDDDEHDGHLDHDDDDCLKMGISTSTIMKSEWDYFRCHIEAKMPRNDEDCARHHRPRERRTDRRMDRWMDGGTDRRIDIQLK